MLPPIKKGSLFFAPMEGVTDAPYRELMEFLYPEWDYLACDFLRVPSSHTYPDKHVIKHFGTKLKHKTMFQILTSENAKTAETAKQIETLGYPWLDLNIGCPSKTVCKNHGGSSLLKEPKILQRIVKDIRSNFKHRFTVKMRIGYSDDSHFVTILKMLEDEGVEAITIHARTREQLYKGRANWDYIAQAVNTVNIPIIGNGDIWNAHDIDAIQQQTNCHAVMIARGALQSPWLASTFKQHIYDEHPDKIMKRIRHYLEHIIHTNSHLSEDVLLKKLKGLSHYLYTPLPNGEELKRKILRAQRLSSLVNQVYT
jgi:nifR3 family TIM-barrel protein